MKGQDVIVLLKLHLWKQGRWKIVSLANSISLSSSETHAAIKRLERAKLFDPVLERPTISAMEEFLIHGLKYVFPADLGSKTKGIPTAHSASPMAEKIVGSDSEMIVWPLARGTHRGISCSPLYRTAPAAALADRELYELLALIDCLRIGRAREQEIAKDEIVKRIRSEK